MNNELKITATANIQQANTNLQNLQKTLLGSGQVVKRVGSIMDKSGNEISKSFTTVERKGNQLVRTIQRIDSNGQLRGLSQSVTDVRDKAEKTTSTFQKLKQVLNVGLIFGGVKTIGESIKKLTDNAIDYSESLNLFNVVFKNVEKDGKTAFSEVGKQATEFQEKLQKNFGADRTESMYFQGLYQSMAESQGIADKYANIMSENSTKLTYDLSSLFNQNQKDTAEALRAGIYAGQTKPLRSYGLDITETSLQKTLDKLKETNAELDNLEVRDMSQAEKQILRYLTVLDQATVAQGDFANTIESPANQMKILTNQIREMGVALGNLLLAPLQKFLTFANTIVIVVKQVAQSIASLFGIKTKDYNTGIASAGDVTDDLSDSLDSAGSSADKTKKKLKELKRETLGFDQINNINEQKDNDSKDDDGSGGVGGINQALLDALKGYDNGLDKVRLKAQQIADQIMRWLGFTYDAEEGVWKLGSAYDNLIKSCKNLGKALDVLGKYSFDNLVNFYNNFLKPVAKWTLGKGLPEFVDITANGIMKTDWANLNAKLNNFYKALAPFTIHIGEGLLWFYKEVLVPLGSFTIGKVVPEFVDILANSLKILNNTIEVLAPTVDWLWQNFLKPIASWTGGIVVGVLKDINSVLDLISKSKVASTIATLGTAFVALKTSSSLASGILSKLPKSLQVLFADGKKTSEILGDSKPTGLTKIFLKLKPAITSIFSPTTKLVSSIKNASTEAGKFTKATKDSGSILDLFKSKSTGMINGLKNIISNLKNTNGNFKDLFTKMKNGITTWSNTTTGMDKLKTAMVGVGGAVISLHGVSSAMKDIAENGANLGNVSTAVASGLGSIASGAMIGTSVLPGWGTAIGACAGGVLALVTGMQSFNSTSSISKTAIENLNTAYTDYKTRMDEINSSFQNTITTSQTDMEVKLAQIENARGLASELENLIDVNGRVKAGEEEKAQAIISQLNPALGTQLSLEGNVISNNGQIISSKQQYIDLINQSADAIQKETLLETYQTQYKAAVEAQVQAKKEYNDILAKENKELQDTLERYKNQEIGSKELKDVVNEAEDKKTKAHKKYQDTLDSTNGTIKGLKEVTESYAKGSTKELENTINKVTSTNKKSLKETKSDYKNTVDEIKTLLGTAKEKTKVWNNEMDKLKNKKFTATFDMDTSSARRKYNSLIDDIQRSNKRASTQLICPTKISSYASGGFPEEGPFYMNRGEIAGRFGNGKSVVANNQQITDGIKYAVMEGMAEVMRAYGGASNVQVDVRADKGFIVETAIDGINDIYDRTGESPVRVF